MESPVPVNFYLVPFLVMLCLHQPRLLASHDASTPRHRRRQSLPPLYRNRLADTVLVPEGGQPLKEEISSPPAYTTLDDSLFLTICLISIWIGSRAARYPLCCHSPHDPSVMCVSNLSTWDHDSSVNIDVDFDAPSNRLQDRTTINSLQDTGATANVISEKAAKVLCAYGHKVIRTDEFVHFGTFLVKPSGILHLQYRGLCRPDVFFCGKFYVCPGEEMRGQDVILSRFAVDNLGHLVKSDCNICYGQRCC